MAYVLNPRVLLVEDDKDIRESFAEILADEGYAVLVASNGQEALDLLKSLDLPAVILLDLMMPVKDGFEFRKEQTSDPRIAHIPVIIMSADGQVREKLKRTQADAYLKKPVELETILEVVRRFASQSRKIS